MATISLPHPRALHGSRALRALDRGAGVALALAAAGTLLQIATLGFGASRRDTLLALAACAAVGGVAGAWSVRRERSATDAAVDAALRRLVRGGLAFCMLWYGTAKLFPPGQFGPVPLHVLDTPLGETTPFWLAWSVFGHGVAYEIVLGVVETGCGVLLLADRTERLGLVLVTPVVVNIALVNWVFGVNVLLLALLLLAMCLWLLASHVPWALASFWRHDRWPASASAFVPPPLAPRGRRLARLWSATLLAYALGQNAWIAAAYPVVRARTHGAWAVERSEGAAPRWSRLYLDLESEARLREGSALRTLTFAEDTVRRRLVLRDSAGRAVLAAGYALTDGGRRLLLTTAGGRVEMRRVY